MLKNINDDAYNEIDNNKPLISNCYFLIKPAHNYTYGLATRGYNITLIKTKTVHREKKKFQGVSEKS